MSQPIGNCPDCGNDQPFEPIHASECPDSDGGECPEWACTACGAAVIMGTVPAASATTGSTSASAAASQPVRAA
jgi:hypothetical protein